jgi:Outer membrane protein beta-barrel domain
MLGSFRLSCLCGWLILSFPATAGADWHFTPLIGITFVGDTTIVDLEDGSGNVHWNFGGAVSLVPRGPFGIEGLFVYTPHFFESDTADSVNGSPALKPLLGSKTFALMGNILLTTPLRWNEYGLRPFLSGGLGLLHVDQQTTQPNAFSFSRNYLAYNLGGGAIGFITERTGLRFELRYFNIVQHPDDPRISIGPVHLNYWTGEIGVVFKY